MEQETHQAIWTAETADRQITGIINSIEPLDMSEWMERLEMAMENELDIGSYDVQVQFGPILQKKWHVIVRKHAALTPF